MTEAIEQEALAIFAVVGIAVAFAFLSLRLLPWWCNANLKGAFWRPIASLTHWLDYALWPDSPTLMHAQSIAWYGLLVSIVAFYYRRILGTSVAAGLAGLVGSGRTDLARCIFGVDQRTTGNILVNGVQVSIQSPGDAIFGGTAPATRVELDFLATLLAAIQSHGGHYAVASQVQDADVELPLVTGPGNQVAPQISGDGAWLVYKDYDEPTGAETSTRLMRVPLSGGPAQLVTDTQPHAIQSALSSKSKALIVETISNPLWNVVDIPALVEVCRGKGVKLLVDDGPWYFDLRGVWARGSLAPCERPAGASEGLTWFDLTPEKTAAWHYGSMREG